MKKLIIDSIVHSKNLQVAFILFMEEICTKLEQ